MAVNPNRADGRFCVRIYLGQKDGRKQYKAVYGHSQREAEQKALEVRMALKKGLDVASENTTFRYWAEEWLKIKEMEVSESWYKNNQSYVGRMDTLYDKKIAQLRTADLQNFLFHLAKENPRTHKPTSRRTLKGYRDALFQICQLAVDNRVMDYNPAGPLKLPAALPKEPRRALTREEQRWIVETPHRAQRAAMIMMYSGLRRGELIPLTWGDIDLEGCSISVNKSVEMVSNRPVVKPAAKTKAGVRVVQIPQVLAEFLRKERQSAANGPISMLVCPSDSGQMMTDTAWRRMWESYLIDLNFKYGNRIDKSGKQAQSKYNRNGIVLTIPNITAHWLRHTFATMLYLSGVDVLTAKEQLGHSDIKTTLEIYTHLDQDHKKKNISKLDEFLAKQA